MFPFLQHDEDSQPKLLYYQQHSLSKNLPRLSLDCDNCTDTTFQLLFAPCFLRPRIFFLISHCFNDVENCAYFVPLFNVNESYEYKHRISAALSRHWQDSQCKQTSGTRPNSDILPSRYSPTSITRAKSSNLKKKKNLKIMKIYLSCTTTLFQHILLLHTYLLWSRLSSFFLPYKFSLIDSFIHSLASPSLPYLHILSIYLIFLPLLFMYLCMFLSFFLSFRCRASRLWIGMIGYGGVSGV